MRAFDKRANAHNSIDAFHWLYAKQKRLNLLDTVCADP